MTQYLYSGKVISLLQLDKDVILLDIYPHSLGIYIPVEHLDEFLDEMSQAAVYCKLNVKKEN